MEMLVEIQERLENFLWSVYKHVDLDEYLLLNVIGGV